MASAASVSMDNSTRKPSFAKVVASSYVNHIPRDFSSNSPLSPSESLEFTSSSDILTSAPSNNGKPADSQNNKMDDPRYDIINPRKATNNLVSSPNSAIPKEVHARAPREESNTIVVAVGGPRHDTTERPSPPVILSRSSVADDNSTQLSSSDGSVKPSSLDGKSVASGTTFALDEKESLRPDDSASLRAVEEEDIISVTGSIIAGSRTASENGAARAFRDQLNEIDVMAPLPHRGISSGKFTSVNMVQNTTIIDGNQLSTAVQGLSLGATGAISGTAPPQAMIPSPEPDPKLVEALASPRDRLFVLKLEQDLIDFLKDSKENELCLPNCNAFYRMLAHRLADYYLLGHAVDESMTSVKISKTPFCRIPPPLSDLSKPSTVASTPPLDFPVRKIMRRGDDTRYASGNNTTSNSEGPSKTTSEVDGASSDGGQATTDTKNKIALTREEREAKYKEARDRIFANMEETGSGEVSNGDDENDLSRSSSAAGKKKGKKQRNYNDDGFEARSQYTQLNPYFAQPYNATGFGSDTTSFYYGPYVNSMSHGPYTQGGPNATPQVTYNPGYPNTTMTQEGQPPYQWGPQGAPPAGMQVPYLGYPSTYATGYDIPPDFQRNTPLYQPNGSTATSASKINGSSNGFSDAYRPTGPPMNQPWPQVPVQNIHPMGQSAYPQGSIGDCPGTSSGGPVPGQNPYPYGQLPTSSFGAGKGGRTQHPIPGSFNRQQFNPQSQAFIPGGRNGPFPIQQNMSQMNGPIMGSYAMATAVPSGQAPRPGPPVAQPASFNMSRASHNSVSSAIRTHAPPLSHPLPQPVTSQLAQNIAQPNSPQSSATLPVQSTIAKFGTPGQMAHLPPKPPPPATMQTAKMSLPGHFFPPTPRASNPMLPAIPPVPSTRSPGSSKEQRWAA